MISAAVAVRDEISWKMKFSSISLIIIIKCLFALSVNGFEFPSSSRYASAEDINSNVFYDVYTESLHIAESESYIDKDESDDKGKPVANVLFKNKINATGWSFLKITTNAIQTDLIQSRAAGFAEGYVLHHLMAMQYENMVVPICVNDPSFCHRFMEFLNKNRAWISEQVKKQYQDPIMKAYWHQVELLYAQADGIIEGYRANPKSTKLPDLAFHFFLSFGDEGTLEDALHKDKPSLRSRLGHCSALIKVLPDFSDLFVSHTTWVDYQAMLRVLKFYDFKFNENGDKGSSRIAARKTTLSSFPGSIASIDDYNMMESGLVSLETSIETYSTKFTRDLTHKSVLEWVRSMVANRLAYNGNEWTHFFTLHNSGTYNNQWMIVDYNRFLPGKPIQPDTLWIVETLVGVSEMADVSHVLKKQGYWASYNVAYFQLIYNISGYHEAEKKYGPDVTYSGDPRAKIFRRDQSSVKDMKSFLKVMRYNNFKHDPFSRCNCTPPYTGMYAIAARSDLNMKNGIYPNEDLGYMAQGAIDCKATSYKYMKSLKMVAVSSPTFDQQPPFQWSATDWKRPKGQPDLWHFDTMSIDWENI